VCGEWYQWRWACGGDRRGGRGVFLALAVAFRGRNVFDSAVAFVFEVILGSWIERILGG
jgi:hypothetical protein